MKTDGRLARMLHVLVHMGLLGGRETSERIAQMLNTNPVVVRRTLGGLRDHGIVASEGGRGGGWKLVKSLGEVTVLDVQRALNAGLILPAPYRMTIHPARWKRPPTRLSKRLMPLPRRNSLRAMPRRHWRR